MELENGLYSPPYTNSGRLGGFLIEATLIDTDTFYLSLFGTINDGYGVLRVANTGSGGAITATSIDSPAGQFYVTGNATALQGVSTTGNAVQGSASDGGRGGQFDTSGTGTNDRATVVLITRSTSDTPDVGFAASVDVSLTRASGGGITASRIATAWADPLLVSFTSNFEFWTSRETNMTKQLTLNGTGQLTAHTYGSGTFTGTPTFALAVDASGNVIEVDLDDLGGGASTRFGFATEDDTAAENRTFALSTFTFNINTGVTDEEIEFQKAAFKVQTTDTGDISKIATFRVGDIDYFGTKGAVKMSTTDGVYAFHGDETFADPVRYFWLSGITAAMGAVLDAGTSDRADLSITDNAIDLVVQVAGVPTQIKAEDDNIVLAATGGVGITVGTLHIIDTFTPANSTDAAKPLGSLTMDNNFLWYRKISGTWVKVAWAAF